VHDAKAVGTQQTDTGEKILWEYEIWFDFAVGIKAPKGEKLQLYQIREFILEMREAGINIEYVVSDSFQSVDTLQLLEKQGFKTLTNSVDRKKDAYYALRDGLLEGRILLPNNKILYKELVFLKENEKKIDHPDFFPDDSTPGSKDIADAVANAGWIIQTKMDYVPYMNESFIEEMEEAIKETFDDELSGIFAMEGEFVEDFYG
jgi:hypothetical protein